MNIPATSRDHEDKSHEQAIFSTKSSRSNYSHGFKLVWILGQIAATCSWIARLRANCSWEKSQCAFRDTSNDNPDLTWLKRRTDSVISKKYFTLRGRRLYALLDIFLHLWICIYYSLSMLPTKGPVVWWFASFADKLWRHPFSGSSNFNQSAHSLFF